MKELTQKELKRLLHYDPDTGVFTWKETKRGSKKDCSCGWIEDGYRRTCINGKKYRHHRLAWLYIYGYFPEHGIDHINRNPADNRITNLREVNQQCNMRNSRVNKNNTSGITGVVWEKRRNKWAAQIKINGKNKGYGNFKSKLEAAKARWHAEVEHGFPNCNTTSSAYQYIKKET